MNKKWFNTSLPKAVNYFNTDNTEMLFWLYCPVKTPESEVVLPDSLHKFKGLLDAALEDFGDISDKYVYITVKSLVVSVDNVGQRTGWHSDGFLTGDVNYIWSDVNPTMFTDKSVLLSLCHEKSLDELNTLYLEDMEELSYSAQGGIIYKLTPDIIHRPSIPKGVLFRNFVKVSVSDKMYTHQGMSVNHKLNYGGITKEVSYENRNCPV